MSLYAAVQSINPLFGRRWLQATLFRYNAASGDHFVLVLAEDAGEVTIVRRLHKRIYYFQICITACVTYIRVRHAHPEERCSMGWPTWKPLL